MPAPRPHEPAPSPNGVPAPQPPPPLGPADVFAEAEALRAALHEAYQRAGRLLAALKQQKQQSRALRQVVDSLRQLKLDR